MQITEIYLFTNRNTIFFDEHGDQIVELQALIGWKPIDRDGGKKELLHDIMVRVVEDNPRIYISRWGEWRHEISIDEFFSLIGMGPEYWAYKESCQTKENEKIEGSVENWENRVLGADERYVKVSEFDLNKDKE